MKIYIIIVTYNGMAWIEKCLKSIQPTYEIIVIDNNSSDATVSFISMYFSRVKIIKQSNNLGFGRANNIGISYAINNQADYVFLLNQDAYLGEECIENLVKTHKEYPNYGIISPIHLNGEGSKLDKNFAHYVNYDNNNYLYRDSIKQDLKQIYTVNFVNAAGWLLPVKTLKMIGGFDPIFFHYGEDDNYCQRVLYHGLKVGVVPSSFIMHDRENVMKRSLNSVVKKLSLFEAQTKVSFGDINKQNIYIINLKRKKIKLILKFLIMFDFSNTLYNYKEYNTLLKIEDDILKSRKLNIEEGPNYLNF